MLSYRFLKVSSFLKLFFLFAVSVVSILSLVDSSGSTLESVSELLNVDTSLSYAVFF